MAEEIQTTMGGVEEEINKKSREVGGNPSLPGMGIKTDWSSAGAIYQTDKDTGLAVGTITRKGATNSSDTSERIGDYRFVNGRPVVVADSPTGLLRKYSTVTGGTNYGLTFTDFSEAAKNAAIGAITGFGTIGTDNYLDTAGTALLTAAGKSEIPGAKALVASINFLDSINDAKKAYNEAYENQQVTYSTGGDFVKDEKGNTKFVIDYDKTQYAGVGSGQGALDTIDTSKTSARIDGDNNLIFNVTGPYSESSEYEAFKQSIIDTYPELTEETANKIVDDDTGLTLIQTIDKYLSASEAQYYFDIRAIKSLKQIAPSASDEILIKGTNTMLVGYFEDEDSFKEADITICDDNNEITTVNAKEFLDTIKNMDKLERNDFMVKIGNKIESDEITDNERAILQAEANMLYSLSDGNSEYKDIYQKDLADTLGDAPTWFSGNRIAGFFGGKELSSFQNDDVTSGLINIVSGIGYGITVSKVTNAFQKALGGIISKVGSKFGLETIKEIDGEKVKTAFGKIVDAASGATTDTELLAAETAGEFAKQLGAKLALDTVNFGFQVAADMGVDGLQAAATSFNASMSGDEISYDYWTQLWNDIKLDIIMAYGPSAFNNAVDTSGKFEYERKADYTERAKKQFLDIQKLKANIEKYQNAYDENNSDANLKKLENTKSKLSDLEEKTYQEFDFNVDENGKIISITKNVSGSYDDNFDDMEVSSIMSPKESTMVWRTAEEISQRRIDNLLKRTSNKIAISMEKALADKNVMLNRLALMAYKATGDKLIYQKGLRMAGDIRNLTRDVLNKFWTTDTARSARQKLNSNLDSIGKITKDDVNYMNAKVQAETFKERGEKNVDKFYNPWISKIEATRAAQLDQIIENIKDIIEISHQYLLGSDAISEEELKKWQGDYKRRYMPIWTKEQFNGGGEIPLARSLSKSFGEDAKMASPENFSSPLANMMAYINNVSRMIAINDRMLWIKEAASIPGIEVRVYKDSSGSLEDYQSLTKLSEKFNKKYENIKKKVYKAYVDEETNRKQNEDILKNSKANETIEEIVKLRKSNRKLTIELNKRQKALDQAKQEYTKRKTKKNSEALKNAYYDVDEMRYEIEGNKQLISKYILDIKSRIVESMYEAAKLRNSDIKLDIESYANGTLDYNLAKAMLSKTQDKQVLIALDDAIKFANPYVDRDKIVDRKATEAAEKFRADINKQMIIDGKFKDNTDKFNDFANKIYDYIKRKIPGDSRMVEDDKMASRMLGRGNGNEIRYRLNGEVYTMKLSGFGASELVDEAYRGDGKVTKNSVLKVARKASNTKRLLTTALDYSRVLPNLMRDWSRGIITTGGRILLSPKKLLNDLIDKAALSEEQQKEIQASINRVEANTLGDTFLSSFDKPRKMSEASLVRALRAPDIDSSKFFTRFVYQHTGSVGDFMEALPDFAESFTRKRAAETAYYTRLSNLIAKGYDVDTAIKQAAENAYFYAREATVNFSRKGALIEKISRYVPYLSQNFSSLTSFRNTYMNDPIATIRTLESAITTMTAMTAITLSNDRDRKKYFLLDEYTRSHNIIIPIGSGTIITIPLDENIAAFFTPYRTLVEHLANSEQVSFYRIFLDTLENLSPFDISGFSEGDKFNLARGIDKLHSQMLPTILVPFVENLVGHDLYYGSDIEITTEDLWQYGIYDPEAGDYTTKSKNSKILASVSNFTGFPQWKLQNMLSEYGGNVGQFALNMFDKMAGATEDEQGGKEWIDSVFKPFTGADSDEATNRFYDIIDQLESEKQTLKGKMAAISKDLNTATGDKATKLEEQRQRLINEWGVKVTDAISKYISAFEITGGLDKSKATQIFYLYDLYDDDTSNDMYSPDSEGAYFASEEDKYDRSRQIALAAGSGIDKYINHKATDNYYESYGKQAFENTIYGTGYRYVNTLNKYINQNYTSNQEARDWADAEIDKAYESKDYDRVDAISLEYDSIIVEQVENYMKEKGIDAKTLFSSTKVQDFVGNKLIIPSDFMTDKRGRYISVRKGANKSAAYRRLFVKYVFGLTND